MGLELEYLTLVVTWSVIHVKEPEPLGGHKTQQEAPVFGSDNVRLGYPAEELGNRTSLLSGSLPGLTPVGSTERRM